MLLMMMMIIIISVLFILSKHPMTMGFMLFMQTILITLITGIMSNNFWFSYILFLVMIGGMLVLFIYMTSIASNELFFNSNKIMLLNFILICNIFMLYFFIDPYIINSDFLFYEKWMNTNMNYEMNKFFNFPSLFIIILIITYLFITLIAIVKITKIEYGPLRQMF